MEFRLLGPLEVEGAAGLVPLGGTRQRAALAYLLLHTGEVVPTRRLLSAMWPADPVPGTARKILQNAIWRLRRTLAGPGQAQPRLLTQAPGYVMRVEPERVDLMRFERLADRGRAALRNRDAAGARSALREALGLWRGPALADLAESGTDWPELAALEQKRLDVMEDCAEVELLCGHHQSVLSDLHAFVQAEPLRERASGQLMLALYRCGRQADALNVYARIRAALVEGLGLEPGRELQQLQQAILAQDPGLDLPGPVPREPEPPLLPAPLAGLPSAGTAAAPAHGGGPGPGPGREAPAAPAPGAVPAPAPGAWGGAGVPAPRSAGSPVSDAARGLGADAAPDGHRADGCRAASVLMVRFCLGPEFDDLAAGDIDRVLDTVCELAREEIRKAGGCAPSSIGSSLIGLFEEEAGREDHAQRAVRAAVAVRDSLSVSASPLAPPTMVIKGLSVHAAVATGTAFVCRWPPAAPGGGEPWIGGEPVDVCEALLCPAPPGEVHICDETRRRTRETVTCGRLSGPGAGWRVHAVRPAAGEPGRRFEREPDLDLMTGFLGRARQLSTPHLITVLGPSVMDRSRLLMEFHRRLAQAPDPARVLNGSVAEAGDALSAPAGMLAAYCGLARDTDARTAERCLVHALRTVADAATAAELLPPLRSLLAPVRSGDERRLLLAAWRRFMALAALRVPLVLVWDALHRADDALLDTVEQLCADCPDAPLLVVVGAHNDLLAGRPGWAAGLQHAMTLRLTPLSEDTLDHLLRSVFLPDTDAA